MNNFKSSLSLIISIIALTVCVFSYLMQNNTSAPKIVFVQTQKIMKDFQGAIDAQMEYDERIKKIRSELDELILSYQNEAKKFEQEKEKISIKEKETSLEVLKTKEIEIKKMQQMNQKQFEKIFEETVTIVYTQVTEFINKYGKEHNYQLVLGANLVSGDILYGSENLDITKDVVKILNHQYRKNK